MTLGTGSPWHELRYGTLAAHRMHPGPKGGGLAAKVLALAARWQAEGKIEDAAALRLAVFGTADGREPL